VSKSAHSLEAGNNFPKYKKKPRPRAVFYVKQENCFRLRGNASPPACIPGAHCALGALLCKTGNCSRLRGNASPPTHAPGAHCALGALKYYAPDILANACTSETLIPASSSALTISLVSCVSTRSTTSCFSPLS